MKCAVKQNTQFNTQWHKCGLQHAAHLFKPLNTVLPINKSLYSNIYHYIKQAS